MMHNTGDTTMADSISSKCISIVEEYKRYLRSKSSLNDLPEGMTDEMVFMFIKFAELEYFMDEIFTLLNEEPRINYVAGVN